LIHMAEHDPVIIFLAQWSLLLPNALLLTMESTILLPLWAAGNYVPLLFSRSAVEQAAEEILDLTPTGTVDR
jgi:hypothetical protein